VEQFNPQGAYRTVKFAVRVSAALVFWFFGAGCAGKAASPPPTVEYSREYLSFHYAGPNPDAKLFFHLVPATDRQWRDCEASGLASPSEARTTGDLGVEYLAYVLLTGFDPSQGIAGVQFGITYHGEMGVQLELTWHTCTLLEWPDEAWPGPNTGNLLTWHQKSGCRKETPVVVGYFQILAKSRTRIALTPRPEDGIAAISACGMTPTNSRERMNTITPQNLGSLGFGGAGGFNPCAPRS